MVTSVGLLVCDFDETITQRDSTCKVAELAYKKRAQQGKCSPSDDCFLDCPPPWSYFVEKYFKERKEHIKHWGETHPETSLEDHYKLLGSLREVEIASMERVEKYNCLSGIHRNELFEQGRRIEKRDYATEVLKIYSTKHNNNQDNNLYILSTNWSRDMLLGSLKDSVRIEKEHILSNNLVFNETDCTAGILKKEVLTGLDKLAIFNKLNIPEGTISVYIGDSDTDLPCMLYANIGIIMGNNVTLTKYCNKFGIEIIDGLVKNIDKINLNSKRKQHKLFRVQGWKEILDSKLLD
ncbi:hypothetical protein Glove_579g21 [Diversispora epigaea]|uniref:Haloacid dehalogenase-like hydrolase n=1 Tax=Diversispora epigaea TaxID=1348612 RepID=A0A397GDJ6_9GLOM|nr:hypothetical protein Glove_579g21 [Diversispora epigaea]